jgi:hypothetical protein
MASMTAYKAVHKATLLVNELALSSFSSSMLGTSTSAIKFLLNKLKIVYKKKAL